MIILDISTLSFSLSFLMGDFFAPVLPPFLLFASEEKEHKSKSVARTSGPETNYTSTHPARPAGKNWGRPHSSRPFGQRGGPKTQRPGEVPEEAEGLSQHQRISGKCPLSEKVRGYHLISIYTQVLLFIVRIKTILTRIIA